LAPEHPFPAALEDALDAYRWLLSSGFPGDRIVIAGDSAGGHLAASLTAEILRTGLPGPAGVVLYSPWVDLSCEMSTKCDTRDPYISASIVSRVGRRVVGSADLTDPRLALLGCSWAGMPPFLIQVGEAEILLPEVQRLARSLTEADVACELQVWPGQMHVFQILGGVVPEAGAALRDTARFVRSVLASAAASAEAVA
jgi:acetyl esterase/lipase